MKHRNTHDTNPSLQFNEIVHPHLNGKCNSKQFFLKLYFESFKKVKESKAFDDGMLENFFIVTNKHFDGKTKRRLKEVKQLNKCGPVDIIQFQLKNEGESYYFEESAAQSLMKEITLNLTDAREVTLFKEFLKKFKICVSQPNDMKIKAILKQKLGDLFEKMVCTIDAFSLESNKDKWIGKRKLFEECLVNKNI